MDAVLPAGRDAVSLMQEKVGTLENQVKVLTEEKQALAAEKAALAGQAAVLTQVLQMRDEQLQQLQAAKSNADALSGSALYCLLTCQISRKTSYCTMYFTADSLTSISLLLLEPAAVLPSSTHVAKLT